MDKRQKNILVWVLTWAGLLLAVLYSPFGSPDLYGPKRFYIANQAVAFNGISIASYSGKPDNTSKIDIKNNSRKYKSNVSLAPVESSILKNSAGESKKITTNTSQGTTGVVSNNTSYPVLKSSQQETNYSNSGGMGIGGELYSYSCKNSKNKGNNLAPEVISLSTDLSLFTDNNNSTKQTSTSGLAGTTDPGGDPTGDPIPVGEGWLTFLFLGIIYTFWKFSSSKISTKKVL